MKRAFSLLLAGLLLVCFTACQPTPEEEVVTYRDAEALEEKINTTPAPETSETDREASDKPVTAEECREMVEAYKATLPSHWSDYIETEYIQMHIEADIVVNNTEGFPVYKVKRRSFDLEKVEAMASWLMPDVTGIREGFRPLPEEYSAAIASLNKRNMTEYAQAVFEEAKEAEPGSYTDADRITLTDADSQFYVVRLADGTLGQVYMKDYYDMDYHLYLTRGFDSIIHLQQLLKYGGSYEGEGDVFLSPSITVEQAREKLDAFLQENGLEEFQEERVEAGRHFAFLTREEISQGWRFELVPSYGYYPMDIIQAASDGGWLRLNKSESYSKPWQEESLYVYISESGVEYVKWNTPMEVTECVNPCVELMDFEEIQKKIKNLLTMGISWFDTGCTEKPTVTKLVLATVPQQIKDDADTAYLMPVWVAVIDWYDDAVGTHNIEVLALNAIDGSRAELRWDLLAQK